MNANILLAHASFIPHLHAAYLAGFAVVALAVAIMVWGIRKEKS